MTCAHMLRSGRPCTRPATRGEAYCAQCRQAQRKQARIEQLKQQHVRHCACGRRLSVYAQRGQCAGCAGRAALAAYWRRGEEEAAA